MQLKLTVITLTVALSTTLSKAATVQSSSCSSDSSRAAAVKASFRSSFEDYLQYARGSDELLPISKKGSGGFGNWGATYVDALTTAHVMGFDDIVKDGITFTKSVDFNHTSQTPISLFETNIRYLASCLSLYELTGKSDKGLIKQAKTIGDHLLAGWVGDNAIPYNSLVSWNDFGAPDTSNDAIIAEGGTLILEFDRLSKYTGDSTYLEHAAKSMKAIVDSVAVLPGLYGQGISPKTNQATNDYVTWGGGSDSFFEYLIKYGQLIGSTDTYIPTWVNSVKSSVKNLITHPAGGYTGPNLTHMADYSPSNGGKIPRFSHLGCFVGGNWILGGRLLTNKDTVNYGLALADSCIGTYTKSATGIGPESYVFKTESGGTNGVTIHNEAFYDKNGFDYDVVDYVLRPEVLESVFYAYRATGDKRWQDLAWTAFNSIKKYCQAPAALAAIENVTDTNTKQIDNSQSFLYAELYKYLFLIFDDPEHISLDKYVFNTEAHPFEVEKPNADYSAASFGSLPSPERSPTSTAQKTASQVPKPTYSGVPGLVQKVFNSLGLRDHRARREDLETRAQKLRRVRL
ncbi:seven-hairpin glycosidase [Acaromyces ingoldii]|uniref:alpha-1,2-Mannosidase n=1 Tax=Acaromyces ingoldii TaxID=215250 RepID=A0A316YP20_9BASI|nr:seven-hairpin glycosidase [Acaromyces ingoldii]PWN90902.1 seven-hairpin glycosidase [Acaromyces ingoldii]